MADTFESVWRAVRLRCPLAGPMLARDWVSDVYKKACDRGAWSWLRSENEIITNAGRSGTVDVTRSSATVTGVSLTFVAADVDRQFRVGGSTPVYTITAVDLVLNTATLDRVYGSATATATSATVLDAYVTMPADFGRFLGVLDPSAGWQLHYWITEDELNQWDPQRSSTGQPWCLASRRLATTTALNGRVQYELWPYSTTARNYPYYYIRQPEELADTDTFEGPLRMRGDILLNGALAEAAEWPGTVDQKNPYFNLGLADRKRKQFEDELSQIEVRDQEIYLTWLETVSWINRYSFAPGDARFAQSHDL